MIEKENGTIRNTEERGKKTPKTFYLHLFFHREKTWAQCQNAFFSVKFE